jgi:glycosyltransferase involved in cell wall biosynthesis
MRAKKRVLMVSYFYPPSGPVGSERALKFAKYLPSFGYEPHILTTSRFGPAPDDDQQPVHRAVDMWGVLVDPIRRVVLSSTPGEETATPIVTPDSVYNQIKSYLMIPDQQILWYPGAVWLGQCLLSEGNCSILLSTSPPETNHLVGLSLHKLSGVPWVADFRDGWVFEPLRPPECMRGWRGWVERWMERQVISTATQVVAVSTPLASYFVSRYPRHESKVQVITNGFDAEDISNCQVGYQKRTDEFLIVHAGALSLSSPDRSANSFLEAVARMTTDNAEWRNALKVVFIGRYSRAERQLAARYGVERWVEFKDLLPKREALEWQRRADALLLILGSRRHVVSSKLFEYLAMRKPVLALAQDTEAGRIVEELNAGIVVGHNEVENIILALEQLLHQWKNGSLDGYAHADLAPYERRQLTAQLAAAFDQLLAV